MTLEETKQLIEKILKSLSIEFDEVEIRDIDTHPKIQIRTKDSGVLIGTKGENLRALNYLVKRIVEQRSGEKHTQFLLDVNGYQERRIEEIKGQARMLAERARMFRYDVEMSPMNAYERMIVHATFTEDPEIDTQSQGEGRFRRVIIKYHSKAAATSSTGNTTTGAEF